MPISRRHFLQSTGVAASTLAMSEAVSAAQEPAKTISPNDRVQIGCIGFGIMGQGDMRTEASLPGVEIVAVSDVYDGRRTLAQERYGKHVFTTRDYRELLARRDVDAVIIATPDHWHARIATDALHAGKDVYCQKPMVREVPDGHMVIEAQKQTGRILQVGSQRVSSILYAKAKELVKSGMIGQIHLIEAYINRNSSLGAWQYTIPPDASPETIDWDQFLGSAPKCPFEPVRLFRWRDYRAYGTGIPGDLFVHLFTGIHFVMDSVGPERIAATGGTYFWKDGRDVPDLMTGLYDYPETPSHPGFQINFSVNFEAGSGEGADSQAFRFIGTEGVLNLSVGNSLSISKRPPELDPGTTAGTFSKKIEEQILAEHAVKYPPRPETADSLQLDKVETFPLPRGYSEQVAHHQTFQNAIRTRTPVVEDAVFGLRAAGPALMSNVSYFERRMVSWDPVNMRML
ncbi:MAG TPA: Gfo/Idh/MocA family oxidoreductase [Bryobacteraceae bacterium]|jgi:predicted dehydrogenase|nr:Gfo/Idh/MocA family oxidoreductase [Bryobacteraceae bacterium]